MAESVADIKNKIDLYLMEYNETLSNMYSYRDQKGNNAHEKPLLV